MESSDNLPKRNVQIFVNRSNDFRTYYSESSYIWVDENMIQVEFFTDKTLMPSLFEFEVDEKGDPLEITPEPDYPIKRERTIQFSLVMTLNNIKELIESLQDTVIGIEERNKNGISSSVKD